MGTATKIRYCASWDVKSVADPGFPRGGDANSKGGCEKLLFSHFSQKLHEIEKIWIPGVRIPGTPLRSVNANDWGKSHLSNCFWLFAPKVWEVVGTYKLYFIILQIQFQWWGLSEVIRTLKHYLLYSNLFEIFCNHRWRGF